MEHMLPHMLLPFVILLLVAVAVVALIWRLVMPAPQSRGTKDLALPTGKLRATPELSSGNPCGPEISEEMQDTLFVLPDISNYTRFMTGNRFSVSHAQHIVFSLINAMIEAATEHLEFSKLEGDAALFYADAGSLEAEKAGLALSSIFRAFYNEQKRLIASNICPCSACTHISTLDLKIFVHRGMATRFTFQGAVDHFGTDVIVLHRLMKNGVESKRYIMVTDSAAEAVNVDEALAGVRTTEHQEHIGEIGATVFELSASFVDELSSDDKPKPARVGESVLKMREAWRSLFDR